MACPGPVTSILTHLHPANRRSSRQVYLSKSLSYICMHVVRNLIHQRLVAQTFSCSGAATIIDKAAWYVTVRRRTTEVSLQARSRLSCHSSLAFCGVCARASLSHHLMTDTMYPLGAKLSTSWPRACPGVTADKYVLVLCCARVSRKVTRCT